MRLGLRSILAALGLVLWTTAGGVAVPGNAMAQPAELMLEPLGDGNFIDALTGNLFRVRAAAAGLVLYGNCPDDRLIIAAIDPRLPQLAAGPDPAPPSIDAVALTAVTRALTGNRVLFQRGGYYAMLNDTFIWCGRDPPPIPDQGRARVVPTLGPVPPGAGPAPSDALNLPLGTVVRAEADALGVVAALMGGGTNRPMCTGSLVGDRTLLTAAHCVCDGQLKSVLFTNDTRWVVPGDPSVTRGVLASYRLHDEDFCEANDEDRRTKIDLALVYTEAPLGIDPTRYLRLSEGPADLNGDTETIVGFGMSNLVASGGQKQLADLTDAQSPVRPCTAADAATGCNPGLELFVVNTEDFYRDTCPGDSGGPLFAWSPDGTAVIVGITLGGLNGRQRICGEGGIYLDLTPPGPDEARPDLALWIRNCLFERLPQGECS